MAETTSPDTTGSVVAISLAQAALCGIERVRSPKWANPFDHIKIDIIDGQVGPWLHLWCPFNLECSGCDPQDMLSICNPAVDIHAPGFLPYTGPLPGSPEYQAEVARFTGVMQEQDRG